MSLDHGISTTKCAPIPILSYHQTDKTPPRGIPYRSLVLPPAEFRRQMLALRRIGYQGLSMGELVPYLRGQKSSKVVGITLDDGYLSNFEYALPVLREVGFTATAFIVSGQLGGSNVWDRPLGVPPKPLMDRRHLKAWIAAGMEVGGHTRNHINLLDCDDDTARDQIAGSKRDLERELGVEVRSFCYPYGGHRVEHAQMVREAGYATATTAVSARARWDDDLMRLPRMTVWLSTPLPLLLAKVATGLEDWRRRRPMRGEASTDNWSWPWPAQGRSARPGVAPTADGGG